VKKKVGSDRPKCEMQLFGSLSPLYRLKKLREGSRAVERGFLCREGGNKKVLVSRRRIKLSSALLLRDSRLWGRSRTAARVTRSIHLR